MPIFYGQSKENLYEERCTWRIPKAGKKVHGYMRKTNYSKLALTNMVKENGI
jgi:hypothetical protein